MRRQLIIVSSLTAIAQILGFLKLWITARLFGIGPELDGYFLALVVPTLISGVLAGLLQTSLFPVRAKLATEQGASVVARFERSVLLILLLIGISVAGISYIAAPQLLEWSSDRLTPVVYEAALFVLPFAALLIPLNAVGDGLGYMLAMRDRYPIAAAAPVVNAVFGSALLALWPEGGLLNLALGTVIGLALQVTICLVGLARTKFYLFGSLPVRDELRQEWREMARLSAWIFPGVIFANMTSTLPVALIAAYGEGAVSAFGYAWRFHQFAIQLLIMAASPVLIARFAQLVASGNEVQIQSLLKKAIWFSSCVGILSIITVALIGEPLLRLLFGGRFDETAARNVSEYWMLLTIALGPAILGNIYSKIWQARARPGFMTLLAGLGFGVFYFSAMVLSDWLGTNSVPIAIGLSGLAVIIFGWKTAWSPSKENLQKSPFPDLT